jgi:hypothetical protein
MSVFCSLEEAFTGPANPGKHKKKRSKEGFVPGALGGSPDPDRPAEIPPVEPMGPPTASVGSGHPEAAAALHDFFPLPGETAEPEEWSKAFMLEPSNIPLVNGKSTLWRKIPTPASSAPSVSSPSSIGSSSSLDIQKRLDMLTKQLESLTQVKPMQNTAELFLFVAVGLLLLLAVDTLLRFATAVALASGSSGSGFSGSRMKGGGRLLNRRWFKW